MTNEYFWGSYQTLFLDIFKLNTSILVDEYRKKISSEDTVLVIENVETRSIVAEFEFKVE